MAQLTVAVAAVEHFKTYPQLSAEVVAAVQEEQLL
jgi:hypothetical protein